MTIVGVENAISNSVLGWQHCTAWGVLAWFLPVCQTANQGRRWCTHQEQGRTTILILILLLLLILIYYTNTLTVPFKRLSIHLCLLCIEDHVYIWINPSQPHQRSNTTISPHHIRGMISVYFKGFKFWSTLPNLQPSGRTCKEIMMGSIVPLILFIMGMVICS